MTIEELSLKIKITEDNIQDLINKFEKETNFKLNIDTEVIYYKPYYRTRVLLSIKFKPFGIWIEDM